ncbi:MAG: glycosyltransferase [Bacteroidaceae bacterium]|nr:glycosyltransferase [Bacteroidaceae bacterium]
MKLAPVALFVYNRADNTRRTLEALAANTLARETEVFVFSDGGRDEQSWALVREVRKVVREFLPSPKMEREGQEGKPLPIKGEPEGGFRSLTLVERPENYYLERNITEGIAEVFHEHDRIIVLEDDILTSPYYLQYMNEAFELYRDEPRVMHVAGFTNLNLAETPFYFTPHMSGWGWGTWRDRWDGHFLHYKTREDALQGLTPEDLDALQYGGVFRCLQSLDKRPIPWDICWEIAIYRAHGLCLTPGQTMVRNIGLRQGTHFRSWSLLQWYEFDREPQQTPLPLVRVEHPTKDPAIEIQFAQTIRNWGIRYTLTGQIIRYIYKKFQKLCAY